MYCRTCGNKMNDNAEICVKCGVKRNVGADYCQVCGARTTASMTNCKKCGAKLMKDYQTVQHLGAAGRCAVLGGLFTGFGIRFRKKK